MAFYLKEGGAWKEAKQLYVKDANAIWQQATEAYIKINNNWERFHSGASDQWMLIIGDTNDTFRNANTYYTKAVDSVGNIYVAAGRYVNATVTSSIYIAKFNTLGELVWEKGLTDASVVIQTYAESLRFDSNDNLYLVGTANSSTLGYTTNSFMMRLNTDGDLQWQTRWAYPNQSIANYCYDVDFNADNDPVMNGYFAYNLPYPPGGQSKGPSYTFDESDGSRTSNRAWNGGPDGLSSCSCRAIKKAGSHFFMQIGGGVTFTPNVGQHGYSAILKTNMAADTLVSIRNTYIGTYSNLWYYSGVETDGTSAVTHGRITTGSSVRAYFLYNSSLTHTAGWNVTDTTPNQQSGYDYINSYVFDGTFITAAIHSSLDVINLIKFNALSGVVVWQNKFVGCTGADEVGRNGTRINLQEDNGFLTISTISQYTQMSASVNNVMLLWRVPADGTGHGKYGNYQYTSSNFITLASQSAANGSNSNVSATAYTPTDYSLTTTQLDPNLTVNKYDLATPGSPAGESYWIQVVTGGSTPAMYGVDCNDSTGDIYVGGRIDSNNNDAIAMKFNNAGTVQWQRTLSSTGNDFFQGVKVGSDGNVYFGGTTPDGILFAKYNSSGTIQWQRRGSLAGANSGGYPRGFDIDSNDRVVADGWKGNPDPISSQLGDSLIACFDEDGSLSFNAAFGSDAHDGRTGGSVAFDGTNALYHHTSMNPHGHTYDKVVMSRWTSSGTLSWQVASDGGSGAQSHGCAVDSLNQAYGTGNTGTNYDLYLNQYINSGSYYGFRAQVGGSNDDFGYAISVDPAGDIYVVGGTKSDGPAFDAGNPWYSGLICKFNKCGNLIWQRTFGRTNAEVRFWGVKVNAYYMYIAGSDADNKALLLKLPKDGSKTGTYGVYEYEESTLTQRSTSDFSNTSFSTNTATPLSAVTTTLTDAAGSQTATKTDVP